MHCTVPKCRQDLRFWYPSTFWTHKELNKIIHCFKKHCLDLDGHPSYNHTTNLNEFLFRFRILIRQRRYDALDGLYKEFRHGIISFPSATPSEDIHHSTLILLSNLFTLPTGYFFDLLGNLYIVYRYRARYVNYILQSIHPFEPTVARVYYQTFPPGIDWDSPAGKNIKRLQRWFATQFIANN